MDLENMRVCVLGLGYVGLPLAVSLSKKFNTVGFDIDPEKIKKLQEGRDPNNELLPGELEESKLLVTNDESLIKDADFIVVAVPTPITEGKQPDLSPLESASRIIGKNLKKGAMVVYESTVYPGVTEEVCIPILEKTSGMKLNEDFKVGYSPERINPGDREHTLEKITKIVSGSDEEALEIISRVYGKVIEVGLHKAPSIKVAEAAKVIENIQRDLNIALMNELSLIFDKMGIRTNDVLEAAFTKWNFHKYYPGLVGGHCIPVDPYYLTHKAEAVGYNPQVILSGRRINDNMHRHIASLVIRGLSKANKTLNNAKVLILGLTFKEDINDSRNSRVKQLIEELKTFNVNILGCEPNLSNEEVEKVFGVKNNNFSEINNGIDVVIMVNKHKSFNNITLEGLKNIMNVNPVIVDIKSFFNEREALDKGFIYSCL